MAANTTFQIALYSSDLQTDILDLSVNNTLSLATQGGLLRGKLQASGHKTVLADNLDFAATSKIFIYNATSTGTAADSRIYISFDNGTTQHLSIKMGEWAMIPWTANECPEASDRLELVAWAETAGNLIEYGVFDQ